MQIKKIGFQSIEDDNLMTYLRHIIKILGIVDTNCEVIVSKNNGSVGWTVKPSDDKLKELLIRNIKEGHFILGLNIEFSSFKHSPYLTFRMSR